MTDFVFLLLRAGAGGRGKVSFRREKYVIKGGPDGGDGGDGGNVILRGDRRMATLKDFAGKVFLEAERGQSGGKRKMAGARGEDLVVRVPIGTQVVVRAENKTARTRRMVVGLDSLMTRKDVRFRTYEIEWGSQDDASATAVRSTLTSDEDPLLDPLSGEPLADELQGSPERVVSALDKEAAEDDESGLELGTIEEDGQEIVLCQGGFGGKGNEWFKSSVRTTPRLAQWGTPGEVRLVSFELKLLADVGMVGFPNAGKSTLLSILTKARPKIAAYPFTTLEPHLGIMALPSESGSASREIVVADLPGLIEGASEGKGLGHAFLRHIENCRALLYMLALSEAEVYSHEMDTTAKAELVWQQYEALRKELGARNAQLLEKPSLLVFNKADTYPPELVRAVQDVFKQRADGAQVLPLSGVTGTGKEQLATLVANLLATSTREN